MKRKKIVLFVYNSYNDPLFHSALYEYMLDNASTQGYSFLLITYEQNDHPISPEDKILIKKFLKEKQIQWVDLSWHSGSFKVLKKGYDLLLAFFILLYYRFSGFNKIMSFGTLAGSISHVNSKILWMDHCVYQYEPHSEFLRDCGVWSTRSWSYRILHHFEKRAAMGAKILATGTSYMLERLKDWKSPAQTYWVPAAVNDTLFYLNPLKRKEIREKLGFQDKKVITYIGKFGEFYYSLEEVVSVFKEFYYFKPTQVRCIILTPQDSQPIHKAMLDAGIPANCYFISKVPYSEVHHYLSASDFGLVAIPSQPAQKFRSPIKVGEYLCCGMPYLVCQGISEDDVFAEKENIGVVVKDFSSSEIQKAIPKVFELLEEDPETRYQRCRQAGIKYRGLSKFKETMREIMKKL